MGTFDITTEYSSNICGDGLCGMIIPGAGDIAATSVEYFDLPYYMRDPLIDTIYLPATPGGVPVATSIQSSRAVGDPVGTGGLWVFEIRDENDVFIEDVTNWLPRRRLRMEVDQPSKVAFSVTADSAHVANLVPPNRLWLRDRWDFYVATFEIMETPTRRDMDATWLDVILEDALGQLSREPVPRFIADSQPLIDTVEALLELQVQSPPLILGQIDSAIGEYETAVELNDTTILGALRTLQSQIPKNQRGYFFVDSGNRLQWRNKIGRDASESLTVGEGLNGVRFGVNWRELVTRVQPYGRGKDHRNRVKLTDSGADQANEWLDDAVGVAAYGIKPLMVVDRRFKFPASLLAFALRILDEHSEPEVGTVISEIIDVAKADGSRFPTVNDLYHGSRYNVVDSDLSINTTVFVRVIEYDLVNPLPVYMEITNKRRKLADMILYLLDQLGEPLDVMDGARYPKIGRNLDRTEVGDTDFPGSAYRNGDWSHDGATPGRMGYWDETTGDWIPVLIAADKGTDIQDVGIANAAGASNLYAGEQHVHNALGTGDGVYREDTLAALPNLEGSLDGARAYVANDGANTGNYHREEGVWVHSTSTYTTEAAAAPAGSIAIIANRPELKRGDGAWKSPVDVN